MMSCPRCVKRGKTWQGADPVCGFYHGKFQETNWNCATLNALRNCAEEGTVIWHEDTNVAVLRSDDGFVLLRWYKQRGRTEEAYFWPWDSPPRLLTLGDAEAFLEA